MYIISAQFYCAAYKHYTYFMYGIYCRVVSLRLQSNKLSMVVRLTTYFMPPAVGCHRALLQLSSLEDNFGKVMWYVEPLQQFYPINTCIYEVTC